ncbi:MAG: metallophosphoesterase [Acidaminococcaceae bacterium]|nr:metallophosphoesterase [Acidaminococcaceae bacterium]
MGVVFFIGAVNIILGLISYLYYRINFTWGREPAFLLTYIFAGASALISRLPWLELPTSMDKFLAWSGNMWVALAYYTTLWSLLHLVIYLLGKTGLFTVNSYALAKTGLLLICGFLVWGVYRAFTPVIRTENIVTAKLPPSADYKIVLLTDIHLGKILGRAYAEKMTERVNALHPDIVLISGDMLDEKLPYVARENSLSPLRELRTAKGVYMAYGNHDYLDRPGKWQQMLEHNGITVLRNQDVIIDGKLKITGVEDYSFEASDFAIRALSDGNEYFYNLLLDHQPRRMETAADYGYDLYLSGHTHTGQLFPNRIFTRRMYSLDYGRKNYGAMTAITSNGYGFWGPPVRTEAAPEIVVINLKGEGSL